MRRLSEIKLKQMLDFLLNEMQMKPGFVLKHKVLFNYSIKRLRERWSIVYNAGCNDVTIMPTIVVLTAKQFSNKFGSYIFVDTFNDPEE
uniref:Uncharacterized protein n=1 Tax=Arion vulgaris TaxID=1028688 RepID=A0A0B6ZMD1_9EUPU